MSEAVDPDNLSWEDFAACKGYQINYFFDTYESDERVAQAIDELCLNCPVQAECAEFAQRNKQQGVWGGIYWDIGGNIDESRNSHKTERVWERIEQRIGKVR